MYLASVFQFLIHIYNIHIYIGTSPWGFIARNVALR